MEFWSVGMDGCTDGKSLSLPTHMNHLKGKYKVLCFKKKVFLISLYERMRYFCLSLINTDKLSSQAEKVTVSNFSGGKLALIFSKNCTSYRKRRCWTCQRQTVQGWWLICCSLFRDDVWGYIKQPKFHGPRIIQWAKFTLSYREFLFISKWIWIVLKIVYITTGDWKKIWVIPVSRKLERWIALWKPNLTPRGLTNYELSKCIRRVIDT